MSRRIRQKQDLQCRYSVSADRIIHSVVFRDRLRAAACLSEMPFRYCQAERSAIGDADLRRRQRSADQCRQDMQSRFSWIRRLTSPEAVYWSRDTTLNVNSMFAATSALDG